MIREGTMVRYLAGFAAVKSKRHEGVFTVLKVEEPAGDIQERMALILHPSGETSWEFFFNLLPLG